MNMKSERSVSTLPAALTPAVGLALALAASPACVALRPPVRNSGAATSPEGIAITVARQRCTEIVEPDWPGDNLVEEVLQVELRNATPAPLTVQRTAFRLLSPEGYAVRPATWAAVAPLIVGGGETRDFELRFMTRGSLHCAREMRLDADAGMTLRERPVLLGDVRFVPGHAL